MSDHLLDEVVRSQCIKLLDHMLEGAEITIAVVADREGGLLVGPSRDCGVDAERVAEVAANVIELGNALAKAKSSSMQDVAICDLKGSPMVVLPAYDALLCVVGNKKANMGMVVGVARDALHSVSDQLARPKASEKVKAQKAKVAEKAIAPQPKAAEKAEAPQPKAAEKAEAPQPKAAEKAEAPQPKAAEKAEAPEEPVDLASFVFDAEAITARVLKDLDRRAGRANGSA